MGWFKRIKEGIRTPTTEKKETPEGLWYKCPKCSAVIPQEDFTEKFCVCDCGYHDKIDSATYVPCAPLTVIPLAERASPTKWTFGLVLSDRLS